MTTLLTLGARLARTVCPALTIAAALGLGTRATAEPIQELYENKVDWNADGRLSGTLHELQFTGGITGNFWPDLGSYRSVGQTFRCPGPILSAVQLGLAGADTGYRGLTYRTPGPTITLRLHRDGPRGEVIAERTFAGADIRPDLVLEVNQPSTPEDVWYLEIRATPHTAADPEKRNTVNANWTETYPHGTLYLNGRPVQGDLHLRIHRQRSISAERPGPVVFWAAAPQQRIWLELDRTLANMLADDPQQPVRLSAAGREWASVQLVATPNPSTTIRSAEIEIEPFEGPGGARIDASNFRIEALRYLKNFRNGNTSEVQYPDPLAPQSRIDNSDAPEIAGRSNHAFVFSVFVADGTPAGVYQSRATVTINDELKVTRPVELVVRNFALPHETYTRTGLFSDLAAKTLEEHLALAEDLASFRIAMGQGFRWDHNQLLRRRQFSEEAYKEVLGPEMQESLIRTGELLTARGLAASTVTPWGDTYRLFRADSTDAARTGIIRFWQTYYPIIESRGWTKLFHARMVDEVKEDQIYKVHDAAELFRQYAPEIDIMVTAMNTPDVVELSKAIGLADIWAPSSRYLARAMDFYQSRVELGEQVWPYIHDHAFLATDSAGPRMFFWMLQKYRLPGVCYFSVRRAKVNFAWPGLEQHTDVWAGDGDLYFTAPQGSANPWWRSLRLHLIRDGIEDREYFLLMERLTQQARERQLLTDSLAGDVERANAWLDRLVWGPTGFDENPDRLEEAREALARAIENLQRALGQ